MILKYFLVLLIMILKLKYHSLLNFKELNSKCFHSKIKKSHWNSPQYPSASCKKRLLKLLELIKKMRLLAV